MAKKLTTAADGQPKYRSGAVARLTGISVDTLRVWERRYGVVGPSHSESGHRLYSPQDVARLLLIKRLVDQGNAIGNLAPLADEQLKGMIDAARAAGHALQSSATRAQGEPIRVAIVGPALPSRMRGEMHRFPLLEVAGTADLPAGIEPALGGRSADVLVMEFPQLQSEDVQTVEQIARAIGARRAVVVYGFARDATVRALRDRGHLVGRAPVGIDELEALCRIAIPAESGGTGVPRALDPVPPRRYDERDLAEVAGMPPKMFCECPRHIAELLVQLGSFESYSAECVSRSPTDAALHAYLLRVSGTARAMFEEALSRVAEAEGLVLPGASARTATAEG
jgi:DNA-binding transcriptional MerR regulator